ncbi:MAG: hypothetical protein P1U37_10005 [Minwuia sp.]|nr:hypothetical protein [Minwuia sp.]
MAEPASRHFSLVAFPTAPTQRLWLVVLVDPPAPQAGAPIRVRLLYRFLSLLRPGFRHVFAISPEGTENQWLVVNPGSDALAVGCLNSTSVIDELRAAVADGRAHVVAVSGQQPPTWKFRGLFTCVATIAHLTGVDAGPFTTPWRLYRRMSAGLAPVGDQSLVQSRRAGSKLRFSPRQQSK